jgi:Ricin-type beta-trefoil lectin domain
MHPHQKHTLGGVALAVGSIVAAFVVGPAMPVARGQERKVIHTGGIFNAANGKALDVQDRSLADGANVQVWDFANAPNQLWIVQEVREDVYAIVSRLSRKALDVQDNAVKDGSNVQVFTLADNPNQLWRLRKGPRGMQIVGVGSNKCLDVDNTKLKENGGNVQIWSCADVPNQMWRFGK